MNTCKLDLLDLVEFNSKHRKHGNVIVLQFCFAFHAAGEKLLNFDVFFYFGPYMYTYLLIQSVLLP